MRRKTFLYLLAVGLVSAAVWAGTRPPGRTVLDLAAGREKPLSEALKTVGPGSIVLVGEYHSEIRHHEAQLHVVQTLHKTGLPVAVGLEMFRRDSQQALDDWVGGNLPEPDFETVYAENWNFPWKIYRMIFHYARANRIPLLGLNVPREITRQVAREGFESLSEQQRGALDRVTCRVDRSYMDFIRKAFGDHGHGHVNFNYFCEAQLVWDSVMAIAALDYLAQHPRAVVVILTGTGHARKPGIPAQIRKRGDVPVTVFLPLVPGSIDKHTVGPKEADYLVAP